MATDVGVDSARQADGGRGHRVVQVVLAGKRDLVDSEQRLLVPPQVTGALRQLGVRAGAERHPPGAPAEVLDAEVQRGDGDVVVALVGEHLQLCGDVVVEAGVAVEVVGREVEDHRGLGREERVLELERRHLAHDRRVGRQPADQRRQRGADVACDRHRQRRLAVDVADPLGRRRLAVGAGHGDELVREQPPRELELPDHGQAVRSRRNHCGSVLGYAGALDERPGAGGKGVA